jgi:hypothetical protein
VSAQPVPLSFVTCVSDLRVFQQRLLASPCLQAGNYPLLAVHNARSAAEGFNSALRGAPAGSWLVWVHQDVHLPAGWDHAFVASLRQAQAQFAHLAVVGAYGLNGHGEAARRAGHVLDRGTLLREPLALPCRADSLDELLFAVQVDSGLLLDPALGFDLYATDLVLQAQGRGLDCAVVDAYCEHWSGTVHLPQHVAAGTRQRIAASAQVFERKWAHKLPLTTPCFDIRAPGDVARFLALAQGDGA